MLRLYSRPVHTNLPAFALLWSALALVACGESDGPTQSATGGAAGAASGGAAGDAGGTAGSATGGSSGTGGATGGSAGSAGAAGNAGVDADGDGLIDAQELAIAQSYYPYYSVSPSDKCPLHGVLFRASPHPADASKIALWYVVLYENDCGAGGHVGDDEVFGALVDPSVPPPAGLLALRAISHQ
jgi:hypothetical protein